jgi:hypothetical protein
LPGSGPRSRSVGLASSGDGHIMGADDSDDDTVDDYFRSIQKSYVLTPKLVFEYKEGTPLKSVTVASTTLLSGTKANKIAVESIPQNAVAGEADGALFLETTMDIRNSLLFHPDVYNEIIGEGTPLFATDSSRMVAMREAVEKKIMDVGTSIRMFADLSVAAGPPFHTSTERALALGSRNNMQLFHHLEFTGQRKTYPTKTTRLAPLMKNLVGIRPSLTPSRNEKKRFSAGKSLRTVAAKQALPVLKHPLPAPQHPSLAWPSTTFFFGQREAESTVSMAANSATAAAASAGTVPLAAAGTAIHSNAEARENENKIMVESAIVPFGSILGKRPQIITSLDDASDSEDDDDVYASIDNKKPRLIDLSMDTSLTANLTLEEMIASYYEKQEIITFTPAGNDVMDVCWNYSEPEDAADLDEEMYVPQIAHHQL